jgi:sulfur carrier protein ThiS
VIVARNGVLVPEDAIAGGDDQVRIIRVSHGG